MATPNEKLAAALVQLKKAEDHEVVQSASLTRLARERLLKAGFLQEIVSGWYFISNPLLPLGSTAWFASYWDFVRQYLHSRFGTDHCLNPESSLSAHAGSTNIPDQLVVMSSKGNNRTLNLANGVSIFIYQDLANFPQKKVKVQGLNAMEICDALVRVSEGFYRNRPIDAATVLNMIDDVGLILVPLLDQGKSAVAGRIAGAFRYIGKSEFADRIMSTMKVAGYDPREINPFARPIPTIVLSRNKSPYEIRIRTLWAAMRTTVIDNFPAEPTSLIDSAEYLKGVDEIYTEDAYNSLSIEGYRVTEELIERVSKGSWNPSKTEEDKKSKDALAARGYFEAFQAVKTSLSRILQGQNPVRTDHHEWHNALFGPSVQAGISKPSDLAGYRRSLVIINGSRHVPLPYTSLMDAMGTLFDLIEAEDSPAVRAVLGHFIFVYIHPYADGNGRLGRFLMNAMLASGGYPWTVIRLETRTRYMAALESASVRSDIKPFIEFIAEEMISSSERLVNRHSKS